MKKKARYHSVSDGINLGDRLIVGTPSEGYHGIYLGSCKVATVKSGIVVRLSLEEFSSGAVMSAYAQTSDFAAAEVVRRAESLIGKQIAEWDDYCFCEWCLKGMLVAN